MIFAQLLSRWLIAEHLGLVLFSARSWEPEVIGSSTFSRLSTFLPIMTSSDHNRHHRFVSRKKLHPKSCVIWWPGFPYTKFQKRNTVILLKIEGKSKEYFWKNIQLFILWVTSICIIMLQCDKMHFKYLKYGFVGH